ncbi:MAG: hypothetical protein ABJB66_04705 [Gemmatimonadaceae bacterium]
MPQVLFDSLPPNARVWVFGASARLDENARTKLLQAVDEHLAGWRAHGSPLVCARDWRNDRFLAIGVDEAATGASGCSIDGMFRVLQSLQEKLGTQIVGGGTIYWRDTSGAIQSGGRMAFIDAVANGQIVGDTPVFDLTVATVGNWRENFERAASTSWHGRLLKSESVTRGE